MSRSENFIKRPSRNVLRDFGLLKWALRFSWLSRPLFDAQVVDKVADRRREQTAGAGDEAILERNAAGADHEIENDLGGGIGGQWNLHRPNIAHPHFACTGKPGQALLDLQI